MIYLPASSHILRGNASRIPPEIRSSHRLLIPQCLSLLSCRTAITPTLTGRAWYSVIGCEFSRADRRGTDADASRIGGHLEMASSRRCWDSLRVLKGTCE